MNKDAIINDSQNHRQQLVEQNKELIKQSSQLKLTIKSLGLSKKDLIVSIKKSKIILKSLLKNKKENAKKIKEISDSIRIMKKDKAL